MLLSEAKIREIIRKNLISSYDKKDNRIIVNLKKTSYKKINETIEDVVVKKNEMKCDIQFDPVFVKAFNSYKDRALERTGLTPSRSGESSLEDIIFNKVIKYAMDYFAISESQLVEILRFELTLNGILSLGSIMGFSSLPLASLCIFYKLIQSEFLANLQNLLSASDDVLDGIGVARQTIWNWLTGLGGTGITTYYGWRVLTGNSARDLEDGLQEINKNPAQYKTLIEKITDVDSIYDDLRNLNETEYEELIRDIDNSTPNANPKIQKIKEIIAKSNGTAIEKKNLAKLFYASAEKSSTKAVFKASLQDITTDKSFLKGILKKIFKH